MLPLRDVEPPEIRDRTGARSVGEICIFFHVWVFKYNVLFCRLLKLSFSSGLCKELQSRSPTEMCCLVVFLVSLLQFDKESTEQLVIRRLKRLRLHTAFPLFFFYAKRIVRAKPHGNAFHTSRHINTIAGKKFPPRLLRSVLRVC